MRKLQTLALTTVALSTVISVASGCGMQNLRPGALAADGGWSAVAFSTSGEARPVVLHYGDADKLTALVNAGVDVWSIERVTHRAKCELNASQADLAKKLGMKVELMAPRETQMRVDKGYRSYEQVAARMQELAKTAPDFVKLVDIGDSWEKTQGKANRDILALKIGKGTGKPIVTFVGGTHAREIATPEVVLMEAENLVTNYGKDAAVTAAVDNREIWIVPMVNPDGHVQALTGKSWRKNTNDKDGGKRNAGIDLNRNYGSFWGLIGDSSNPDSDTFRGPKAFSEPESQAVMNMCTAHVPAMFMTFHSFSNCVMWPWDHTHDPVPDKRLKPIGEAMGKLSGYDAYQGSEMYLNGGDDEEWVFDKLKSLAFTVEIGKWGDGFMPPFAKVAQFFGENQKMMAHALKIADNPAASFEGPALTVAANRAGLTLSSKDGRRAEAFFGAPGKPGTGTPVAMVNGQAVLPAAEGPRRVVYVHAQNAQGVWGSFETAWSR